MKKVVYINGNFHVVWQHAEKIHFSELINADTKRCVRFDLKFLKFKIKGLILTSSGTLSISHFADDAAQNIISLMKGSTVAEHNEKAPALPKLVLPMCFKILVIHVISRPANYFVNL